MHAHSGALHFTYDNFLKIHQSLRTTPARAAGLTDGLWEIEDLGAARSEATMNYVEIADCAGVTLHDLSMLLQGAATVTVADQLGVTMADVEAFINGADNAPMTHRLGLQTMAATVELGTAAGRNGAIGIILGLLLSD